MSGMYTAKELSSVLKVSESQAYKLIRGMNEELKKNGYLTVRGKIPAAYVEQRFYGVKKNDVGTCIGR